MTALLRKIFLFLAILAVTLIIGSVLTKNYLRNGDFYRVKGDTNVIMLGHSQPECGLNDSLVPHLRNFAQGGESYFYTYQKAKKLLADNPQIKTVIISYANNQINERMDKWIWDDKYIYNSYPKYNFMMETDDYSQLFRHNFTEVLKAETKAFKDFASFASKGRKDYLANRNWGGYLHLKRNKIDSLLKTDYLEKERRDITGKTSETNIEYLEKIVALCQAKGVKVLFIRMPARQEMPFFKNEAQYQQIKSSRFAAVELLDFKDFPAVIDEYGDFDHLNHKGAARFSAYFNQLMEAGLLRAANKQQQIDASIAALTSTQPK